MELKQTQLRQLTSKKPFKLVLSESLERKIRTYCALSPDREWSGVLFYTFTGTFKDGITINADDFYLMDQGSGAHTEFDLNEPEATRYMVLNGLTDHCMGLCHSHNRMKAFFSGEDASTLEEYGKAMNNFVSLVVCNEGPYVARLTRKSSFNGKKTTKTVGKIVTPFFNTDTIEEHTYQDSEEKNIKDTWIEYIDLTIERPYVILEDHLERFGEIANKVVKPVFKSETKFPTSSPKWENWERDSEPTRKQPRESVYQPSLFDDVELVSYGDELDTQLVKEIGKVRWEDTDFNNSFHQLLLGSPFAGNSQIYGDLLTRMYSSRFRNAMDFACWFDTWLDFITADFIENTVFKINIAYDEFDIESLFLGKVLLEVSKYRFVFRMEIVQAILQRLE